MNSKKNKTIKNKSTHLNGLPAVTGCFGKRFFIIGGVLTGSLSNASVVVVVVVVVVGVVVGAGVVVNNVVVILSVVVALSFTIYVFEIINNYFLIVIYWIFFSY
jgi:hypothetical protein